jgi:hypothetical protein
LDDTLQADRSNSLRGWGVPGSLDDSIREPLARSKARDGGPVMLAMHLRGCGSRDHDMGMGGSGSPRMSDGRSDRGFSKDGYSRSSSGMPAGGAGAMGQSQMSNQGGSSGAGSGPGMSAMSSLTEKCLNVLQVRAHACCQCV